ncbi:MAG: alpha/beta hydrolase [Oscillospiraceae bacterium]|nr:alpha/beta hydrolase [Oscillospiraceae bacterium]
MSVNQNDISTHRKSRRLSMKRACLILASVIILSAAAFLIYAEQYSHADESAYSALDSDETVSVEQTEYGWFFDGPSETDALIFYPGAKIEEEAYAPLLRLFAEQGMDVCLVRMPFRFAFFDLDKADQVMSQHAYTRWYIGGHSLGGAMAARYAPGHSSELAGVVLLAAYPTVSLKDGLRVITIYGSEDRILNRTRLAEGRRFLPADSAEYVIEGGNHAQFGSYGMQKGDGTARISPEEQQHRTVALVLGRILPEV